ncbi:hypothetical protein MY4824_008720 [Beauveria thailandica]
MYLSVAYDPTVFHSISSLYDANENFQDNHGLSKVETTLKSIILEHGVANLFGVALVHRHFDLDEGTILVEKDLITAPWKCGSSFKKHGGQLIPTSWLTREGRTYPYEFGFFPYSKATPPGLEEHSDFVTTFFDAVKLHGLDKSVGLRRLSGQESAGMLECTEGNVNIMFSSKEIPPECLQNGTSTMWFFDNQPPYRSSTNSNHNHIDQP